MNTSWKIGHVAGIAIRMHITFALLLAWLVASQLYRGGSWVVFREESAFLAALFAIVVLHELGHALAARRYGIRTRDITLLPIGGVAHLEQMPEHPREELVIALAGPAVNLLLAALLDAAGWMSGDNTRPAMAAFPGASWTDQLCLANLAMAAFNLIPAFPMDGGRVLRALLALRLDYLRATTVAARIGQGLAMAAGFLGLFTNPFLTLIAVFVWMGAKQEESIIRLRSSLAETEAGQACVARFEALDASLPVAAAARQAMRHFDPVFPVIGPDGLVGLVARKELLKAAHLHPTDSLLRIACTSVPPVAAGEKVRDLLPRLIGSPVHALPVTSSDRLIGLLTVGTIAEYADLHQTAWFFRDSTSLEPATPIRD
ncbi:MAG TPA: site-2 protease family protein [Opitutaceae bacterium]|nr:site-2 protease family protein [Opitutaceae bacterium]